MSTDGTSPAPWSPSSLVSRFGATDLPEQFLLGVDVDCPRGWLTRRCRSWTLCHHPSLPVTELSGPSGLGLGWLLGYPISNATLMPDGSCLELPDPSVEGVERRLADIGGRWLAVLLTTADSRVYLDSGGLLSAVYSSTLRQVGSTPSVLPYTHDTSDDVLLIEAMGIPYRSVMYPLWLTPRRGVERLLPNHYLDLDSFQAHRHWPSGDLGVDDDIEAAATRVVDLVRNAIRGYVAAGPTSLALTAGQDSRLLLACARDQVDQLRPYTMEIPDDTGRLDARKAATIARALGLAHDVLPASLPSDDDLARWMLRTGCGVGEVRGWRATTTLRRLDARRTRLLGTIGGFTRAPLIRSADTAGTAITADRLLEHWRPPRTHQTRSVAQRWLDGLPMDDPIQTLSLFAIEQRLGCWAGVWPYADYAGPGFVAFPFNHRAVLETIMRVPVEARQDGSFFSLLMRQTWPELEAWPYNRDTGVRRVYQAVKRRVGGGSG